MKKNKQFKPMYIGEKHNSLTFLGLATDDELNDKQRNRKIKNGTYFGKFLCDYDKIHIVICSAVKRKIVVSCGCYKRLPKAKDPWLSTYKRFKKGAREREITCLLTKEEYEKLAQMNCFYCSAKPNIQDDPLMKNNDLFKNTIDRVDNNKGYIVDNCVAACKQCNIAKLNHTVDEFENWFIRVYHHFIK